MNIHCWNRDLRHKTVTGMRFQEDEEDSELTSSPTKGIRFTAHIMIETVGLLFLSGHRIGDEERRLMVWIMLNR